MAIETATGTAVDPATGNKPDKGRLKSRMNQKTMEEKIARINELYHKSQSEGLTEEEKQEQAALRSAYVASVRANLKGQLDNIRIQEEDGSVTKPGQYS